MSETLPVIKENDIVLISENGLCPSCGSGSVTYLVVSRTIDTGIFHPLINLLLSRREAILIYDDKGDFTKTYPSFYCNDCQRQFNLNWSKSSLETIYPIAASLCKEKKKADPSSTTVSKKTSKSNDLPDSSNKNSSDTQILELQEIFSSNGHCPYCHHPHSTFLVPLSQKDSLTPLTNLLLKGGFARWVYTKEKESLRYQFQCNNCHYGFNVDFAKTRLEDVFHVLNADSEDPSFAPDVIPPSEGIFPGLSELSGSANKDEIVHSLPSKEDPAYTDYIVRGQFNSLYGKFQRYSSAQHFESRGLPEDHELRQLAYYFDVNTLQSREIQNPPKPKLTKKQIEMFKKNKLAKKRRNLLNWLNND
jgi:transposase-like protein